MKVSIIGGGGLVGSCAGFAIQCGGIVREIALLDVNADLAGGQALDMLHGGPSIADQVISSGGYEHIPDSDVICITAGLRRQPDESSQANVLCMPSLLVVNRIGSEVTDQEHRILVDTRHGIV